MQNSLFEISMMLIEKGIIDEISIDENMFDDSSMEFKEVMNIDANARYEHMLGGC